MKLVERLFGDVIGFERRQQTNVSIMILFSFFFFSPKQVSRQGYLQTLPVFSSIPCFLAFNSWPTWIPIVLDPNQDCTVSPYALHFKEN